MQVTIKFNEEFDYPMYEMRFNICRKMKKIWNKLETYLSDISKCSEQRYCGITINVSKDEAWHIYNDTIMRQEKNIIEVRKDPDRELENEIFKHIPLNMRKYAFNW
jgi:hypothetical protein